MPDGYGILKIDGNRQFSKTRCLDVYGGTNTTKVYNNRSFPKRYGTDAQLCIYNGGSNQKWVFEKATTGVGGAIGYKPTSRTDIRCYQYAMTLKIPEIYIAFNYGDSVQTIRDRTLAAVKSKGKHIREISQNGYIHPTREYRVALRVAPNDYHFLIQLSNGEWAHKRGQLPSAQLGAINPTTLTWNWSGGPNYNSQTIYFAVQAESSSFSW